MCRASARTLAVLDVSSCSKAHATCRHCAALCIEFIRRMLRPRIRDISALCAAVHPAISGAQGIEMTYKGDTFEIFAKDSPNRLVFTVPGTKGVSVLPHQQVL